MRCPRCHTENPRDDAAFCGECGARLEVLCRGCGRTNRLGARFCRACGQPVAPTEARAHVGRETSVVSSVATARSLTEQALTSKVALEGERKQVTVLFADFKPWMESLEDRDPEDARTVADPMLKR